MSLRALVSLEIVRYGAISAVAFGVDLALLHLLTNLLGVFYLVSATLSFIAGGVVAYLLSIRFVFRFRRVQTRAVEGTAFVALGIAGLAANTVVMAIAVGRLGASLVIAKFAAAGVTFGLNYLLRKLLLFTPYGKAT